jgi:hypothetical protein
MKKILGYIRSYVAESDKRIFFLSALFAAFGIYYNYHEGLNHSIRELEEWKQYLAWYLIFLTAFSFPYALYLLFGTTRNFLRPRFFFLLLIAPAIFSWKMVYTLDLELTSDAAQNFFWNQVIYWPYKLLMISLWLYIIWKWTREKQPFYGTDVKGFNAKPYLLMLLFMVPLIAAASTQQDFLAMYPKLKNVNYLAGQQHSGLYRLLYELSYGSDFISIELFFRGFLVLAFTGWVGKNAILPMALFYCTIHFGKPMGECISSFFGGILLGVVTYHTRTIVGGLMVHLGIAWMMELGGYLGNHFINGY